MENANVDSYDGENHTSQSNRSEFIHKLDTDVDNRSCGARNTAHKQKKTE